MWVEFAVALLDHRTIGSFFLGVAQQITLDEHPKRVLISLPFVYYQTDQPSSLHCHSGRCVDDAGPFLLDLPH